MPFQVSPGVNVSEIDLTTVVPAVSSTEGALAGVFRWGPVNQRVLIDSEAYLAARFGKPTNHNPETFFTGANFLSYGNKLYIVRAANTTSTNTSVVVRNAVANVAAISNFDNGNTDVAAYVVKNEDHYNTGNGGNPLTFTDTDVLYIAKCPGAIGNSLKISVCASNAAYTSTANLDNGGGALSSTLANVAVTVGSSNVTVNIAVGNGSITNAVAWATTVANTVTVGDYLQVGNSTIGTQYLKVSSVSAVTNTSTVATFTVVTADTYGLGTDFVGSSVTRKWEYWNQVDAAPGVSKYQTNFGNSSATDELHIIVADEDGSFSGVPGTVLEVMAHMSRATDSKTEDGSTNYYKTVINNGSEYIWWANELTGAASGLSTALTNPTATKPTSLSLQGGTDGLDENNNAVAVTLNAYDLFADAADVDVSLILQGVARGGTNGEQKANYLIDNIAERRKDCVVFCSPARADVVNNVGSEATDVITYRNSLRSTSYAVLDSGYKYQYDKYNDVYRFIPLNGDTAGLCVRTDDTRDPWFSPAGFNRGQVKNIVKLAYNPRQADRDQLYKAGVNPVVTFPGQGTVLYGDKTLLAKPSAFDRINVRRLFIVLEKAIATATKFTLFEFNDDFTRAQFRNLIEPFLRDVQGRRGIYDFKVVCDTTNNTGEVIDGNRFIGDIYIKPAKSINFIQLNFVAVRTGVEFSEVVGKF
jgi:phage tail sheath protein FI